ncbi:catalase [Azospirillum canadense]|uniref:catalase n=1 Tax=Azospirillum canadense TaxID=403962 RepID=UPI002227BA84|nr:catalase [Azospirillum canadense]MCW2244002.1 catalase [Azospirillum canadense]
MSTLTTASGIPVADNQNSLTAGPRGPVLIQDFHLLEKLAHFNRERIPERVVHAKGAGAYGLFRVTCDVTPYTKAAFLNTVGKETEVFLRFSTVGGEKGSADADRDPRGFALKLYTEGGNYDIVGNNTPVFFIRDPLKFPDFIHTQKRNPATNLKDPTAVWDFFSLSPETLHQVTILFSDRGTPRGYRHMDGFSSHTFSWINAAGERFWVKYHFKTRQGIQNLTAEQATRMAGIDPDHATRDLFAAIEDGDHPAWTVSVQIMPELEADAYRINPFDLTKVWPHGDYPLIEVGELILNRNPENYFAEVEQSAFTPANVVSGISFSPDKMLQGRLFAYADAQRYRLGANHQALPVNRPHAADVRNYQRAGAMRFDGNGGGRPNYEPNSFNGPAQSAAAAEPPLRISGDSARYDHREGNDDYAQAGALFRLMGAEAQERLMDNIAGSLRQAPDAIQQRQLTHFFAADPAYGAGIAKRLDRVAVAAE